MPFRQIQFVVGGIYHVFNRGNARRDIFLHPRDYRRFLARLKGFRRDHRVAVLTYCLMPNHFHLLAQQKSKVSLSEMMRKLLVAYSMYFNIKYDNVGSVFQGRFKAKLVESDEYLLQVSRYIHQNPWKLLSGVQVKTGTLPARLEGLERYEWSSYPVYLGRRKEKWVKTKTILDYFSLSRGRRKDYHDFVEEPLTEEEERALVFEVR